MLVDESFAKDLRILETCVAVKMLKSPAIFDERFKVARVHF